MLDFVAERSEKNPFFNRKYSLSNIVDNLSCIECPLYHYDKMLTIFQMVSILTQNFIRFNL